MRTINLFFVSFVLLIFISCQKEEVLEEVAIQEETPYLEFSSKADFYKAMEAENSRNSASSYKKDNFISMYDIYMQIEEEDDEKKRELLIEKYNDILIFDEDGCIDIIVVDPLLASFLSPEGLIKIGNEISLVERNKIKTILDGDVNKIELLSKIEKDSPNQNIKVDEFIQIQTTEKAYWNAEVKYYSGKRKVKWQKWASYGGLTNSNAGGKIKSYKKGRRRWKIYRTNLDITVSWDYIEWKSGDFSEIWADGSTHNNDSKGWIVSTRKRASHHYTPVTVSDLEIRFKVGSYTWTK